MKSVALETQLIPFVIESNMIEGIMRSPTHQEVQAHILFLGNETIDLPTLNNLQKVIAPMKPLRAAKGMNVFVGEYSPPFGGENIVDWLHEILHDIHSSVDPWEIHIRFEDLHPYMDGNGRTGRALWVWQMLRLRRNPFIRPFLHEWYYQTLAKGLVPKPWHEQRSPRRASL